MQERNEQKNKEFFKIARVVAACLVSIVFGIHLIFSAYLAVTEKNLDMIISPSLDMIAKFLKIFGHPTDAYIGALLLTALGALFIIAPIIIGIRLLSGRGSMGSE